MRRPAEPLTGNSPGVAIDATDWDTQTALAMLLRGGRAERRAAKRWLQRQQQSKATNSKKAEK